MSLRNVSVVLVEPEGSINIGFVARVCKNFGVGALYLVNPRTEVGEEAYRFAVKAVDVLESAVVVSTLEEALRHSETSVCTSSRVGQRHDVLRHPLTPEELAERARSLGSLALVFGRESTGLTRKELSMCDLLVTIPANPEYPVLNLSHAVAVILYELWKRHGRSPMPERADPETLRLVLESFERLVDVLGIREPRRSRILLSARRILYQSAASKTEVLDMFYLSRKCLSRLTGGVSREDIVDN